MPDQLCLTRERHTISVSVNSATFWLILLLWFNAAILLAHLKLPFEKIKEAVLACDDSILSEQHLRQMEAFAPDKKEVPNRKLKYCSLLL